LCQAASHDKRELNEKLDRDPHDEHVKEYLVSVEGIVNANWEGKDNWANSLLGLKDEDLDQVIT
jgi:hypothetical protein